MGIIVTTENNIIKATLSPQKVSINIQPKVNRLTISSTGVTGENGQDGTIILQFREEFNQASLTVAGLLVWAHNLGFEPSGVEIYDNNRERIDPRNIFTDDTNVIVNMQDFEPLEDTYLLIVSQ